MTRVLGWWGTGVYYRAKCASCKSSPSWQAFGLVGAGPFHEPWDMPPGFGLRQSCRLRGAPQRRFGATAAGAFRTSKAAEGRRSPRRYRAEACPFRFIVLEQFQKEQPRINQRNPTAQGKFVFPIRYRSHSRAAPLPSLNAHTTRLWPRRQSPAANTPFRFV